MSDRNIAVKILGKTKEYPYGTPYAKIVEEYEGTTRYPIVLVMKNGKLCELHKKLKKPGTLEFVTTADEIGHKTYKRSASLLVLKAVYHVAGHENIKKAVLHYSVSSGYYFTIDGNVTVDEEFLAEVKRYMLQLVEEKIHPEAERKHGRGD